MIPLGGRGDLASYILRRLLLLVPTVLGLATIVFFLMAIVPGDPVDAILGEGAMPVDRETLRQSLNLDRPLPVRYGIFLSGLLHGDLGESFNFSRGTPVSALLWERLPNTAILAMASILLALLISIPLGILAAVRQGSWVDLGSMIGALIGISLPNFWLGAMLIIFFCYRLSLFPMPSEGGALSIVLPAVTLGTSLAGILTRMTRSSMLEVLRSDYIRTARAKGLGRSRVLFVHALKNALIPVATIAGLQFGALMTGAIITETIFTWKGLGLLTLEAIQNRDYPLVQGCILVIALVYVLVNLVVDLLYSWLDPRVQLG